MTDATKEPHRERERARDSARRIDSVFGVGPSRRGDRWCRSGRARGQPRAYADGVPHVVLERVGRPDLAGTLDSFCLVTPNWFCQLPGHPYDGGDPDGFMLRDEVVAYLERYASRFDAPVREGIEVTGSGRRPRGVSCCRPRPKRSWQGRWSSAPAPTSGPTDRQARPHSPRTCIRSTLRTTATRRISLRARCWWSGAASPAARSPRSSTRLDATCAWPAGGLRGCHAGLATGTWLGGRSRLAFSTRPSARCRARKLDWPPTCRRRGPAAATTSTTGRCGGWASPCSATSSGPMAATPASHQTSGECRLGR